MFVDQFVDAALITLRGVTRRYPVGKTTVAALVDVHLAIPRGEFTALVGPSGSGKSTLLNLIGGLDRPNSGEICVDSLSLGAAIEQQLVDYRRTRVGFIFQSFHLLPTFTAMENVEAPMVLAEVARNERRTRAANLLESVGLAQRMTHKPNELSGGEKQRVAIARALVNRPTLLLADEPTGNLDTKTGVAILDLLCNLVCKNGLTLVMVTHDLDVASRADRIIHMRDGNIQQVEAKPRIKTSL
jgi:putative ABC transport system ATP-binding protein